MGISIGNERISEQELRTLNEPAKNQDLIAFPEWTEYRKKNGLDPLGMQNSSVNLYQSLLPGISNVTLRMRYYGLYAWLAQRYAKEIGDTDPNNWKRHVRRAEALYALVAAHHGGEPGVAGTDWATRALEEAPGDTIDFKEAAEPGSEAYYLKQAWGAFGAAYRSQLFDIGIFDRSDDHEIPLPSKDLGEGLAQAFEQSLGSRAELYFGLIKLGSVTHDELDELAPLLPSRIASESTEQKFYEAILLSRASAPSSGALARKLSILLILKVADFLEREPRADEVRWVLYAGHDQQGNILSLNDPSLEVQRSRWWVYHANDLCHIAHEALLKFTLDTLGDYPSGLGMERLIGRCAQHILSEISPVPETWSALLEGLEPASNAFDASDPDSEASLTNEIIRAGRDDARICTPDTAAKAVRLLAILHQRIDLVGADLTEPLGGFNPDAFRSLLSETRFLDRHREAPFGQTIERVLEERVIRRHLWVALRKLRHQGDYPFLIESDDGKLRLREKDGPVFTNPRLGPAITFLKDIGLLGNTGLTEAGREAIYS